MALKKYACFLVQYFICIAILCTTFQIFALADEVKRERPGKLFSPSKISLLEDPKRDVWQKPEEILDALKITKAQKIADIGAGSGYLTVRLLKRIGTNGHIYAVDIQKEMLEYIKNRLNEEESKKVTLVLGDMDDPKLPENSIDVAILLSTYHEIAHPVEFMKKVYRCLQPDGKLAIMEFSDTSPIGPPQHVRLPVDLIVQEMKQAGFTLSQRFSFLLPYQYLLVFTPQN